MLSVATLLLAACTAAPVEPIAHVPTRANSACAILEVIDGETVRTRCADGEALVRLLHFDAPDLAAARCRAERRAARAAARELERILGTAEVIATDVQGRDRFDRVRVAVKVDDTPLSQRMIDTGLAVPHRGGAGIDWCARLRG
jgi:endonuclease YncB( thermonuclease family)